MARLLSAPRCRSARRSTGKNNVAAFIFCLIECAVGARQRLFNVVINERRQANTDGDVGGDAFIKHMRDLQVIDPLTYTLGCLRAVSSLLLVSSTINSSPPKRATISRERTALRMAAETRISAGHPSYDHSDRYRP